MKEKELNLSQSSIKDTKKERKDKFGEKSGYFNKKSNASNTKITESHKPTKPNSKGFLGLPETVKIGKKQVKITVILAITYFLLGLSIAGGMGYYLYKNVFVVTPTASSLIELNSDYVAPQLENNSTQQVALDMQVPSVPRTEESPINGMLFTQDEYEEINKRLPILAMVNNHAAARPQSNLTQADLVYETLVESGITRYLPLFWSNKIEEVGPIRSVRNYHLEFMLGYDGILIHDGQAYSNDPRVDAAGNLYKYNIKDARTYSSWRTYDDSRRAPHNEYSNPSKVWEYAAGKGWKGSPEIESWKFKQDVLLNNRPDRFNAEIEFINGYGTLYDVEWNYDKISNRYYREIGGKKDIDQITNKQISPKVVIIQEVGYTLTGDSKGHVIVETIGDGNARILQDGKAHKATWKKTSRTDRTTYYDEDGEEFVFNRGQIWIQAVPSKSGDIQFSE